MHREARGRAAVWSVHDGDRTQHPCMRKRQEREDIIMGEAALGRQLVARIHQALIARRVARPFLHAVDVRRPTADDSQSAHPGGTVVSTRAGRARAHLDEVQEAGHGQRLGRGHADHQRAAILPSHKELSPIDHTRPLHRRVKLSLPTPKGGRQAHDAGDSNCPGSARRGGRPGDSVCGWTACAGRWGRRGAAAAAETRPVAA